MGGFLSKIFYRPAVYVGDEEDSRVSITTESHISEPKKDCEICVGELDDYIH